MPFRRIHISEDANTIAISPPANTDAHTTAAATVFPGRLLGVCHSAQYDIVRCRQRGTPTRLQLACANQNIAAVSTLTFTRRHNSQVVTCIQGAACRSITPGMLLRF